ncbi:MAG: 16S rRNA (cytidine(1402)-2'-O)-methyltransferase [Erysipelotrichaceae bacterium]|nr:16S rRNA (cytidine(1402)-2'-O)-methyltransferase [Erysipelotrichaceae bacterium]
MRVRSFNHDNGILYLVATPIGNLSDMTYRAVEILKSVDKIYAEDTRNSIYLLQHFNITTKLESYHEYNQDIKTDSIIEELKNGMKIAIISDAGLPIISDPGYKIVKAASELNIAISTIPGASAGISALIASGLAPMPYTFYGFLDSKKTKRLAELNSLKYVDHTIIFYEAPHRIFETLADILEVFGDRQCVIARELTKTYEEYIRGSISELLKIEAIKGEIVLIVSGYKETKELVDNPNSKIEELISLGYKPNEAIKEVSKLFNLDRKELYKEYIEYKNKGE